MAIIFLAGCGSGIGEDFSCQGLGGFTVSGVVTYEKRLYDHQGFTRREVHPVRFAPVEVTGPGGVLLATTTTDSQGRYCAIYIKQGAPTANQVFVLATNAPSGNIQVGYLFDDDNGVTRFAHYAFSLGFDERQGSTNFSVNFNFSSNDFAGAFNIIDTLDRGSAFFKSKVGKQPPLVTAIWQPEIGGTFFVTKEGCRQYGVDTDCIFLRGDGQMFFDQVLGGDRDEYDDDIILHEYGHFIAHNFSMDDSRGGAHFLNDHSQDVRLAWSEGWATFFSCAVRNHDLNVDVGVDGFTQFAFSIDTKSPFFPRNGSTLTTSEVAVSSVLWDIFDGIDSNADNLSLGFGPIWDILNLWKETPAPPLITMEAFWDSFGMVQPAFLSITSARQMEFFEDSFESQNDDQPNPNRKIGISAEHHTFFPAGDVDHIAFEAVADRQYDVETLNLTNGADTFIEILDIDGQTILARNDDVNQNASTKVYKDGCNTWTPICLQFDSNGNCVDQRLQPITWPTPSCPNRRPIFPVRDEDSQDNPFPSRISFTAPVAGIYYAKVHRSPNAPPSTSRYGSYDFRITSP
jgi:hypothetical protein